MSPYICRKGIVLTEIHGVYLLVSDEDGRKSCAYLREINELGAFIWRLLEKDLSEEEILTCIREAYDLPEEYDLLRDVRAFMKDLEDNNYLIRVSAYAD